MIKVDTTAANIFNVDFDIFGPALNVEKTTFQKHKIAFSIIPAFGGSPRHVRVEIQDQTNFAITTAAEWLTFGPEDQHILGIAEIDGVAPVDVDDIYNKLSAAL